MSAPPKGLDGAQEVDITVLSVPELENVATTLDMEIQALRQQMSITETGLAKFRQSIEALKAHKDQPAGCPMLVPVT
ncbi:prefoldin, partial [Kipferlia bialata]|eukprot:g8351.t1